MHRIAATPGGWNPETEGVIFVEQTPAPIVILTAADTDIQTLAAAVNQLPDDFPALRVVNLLQLQQQLTIDTYAEQVLTSARAIVLRLLGGRAYWSYGLEVLQETVRQTGAALIVLPGDDRPDPDLLDRSTVSLSKVNQVWRYFTEGGSENCVNALKFVADICLGQSHNPPPPQEVPRVGLYRQEDGETRGRGDAGNDIDPSSCSLLPKVGLLFYRAHYLAGNTRPIDALCQALAARKLEPVPVFVSSLRDRDVQAELSQYFQPPETEPVQLILNTTSFAVSDFTAIGNWVQNNIVGAQEVQNSDLAAKLTDAVPLPLVDATGNPMVGAQQVQNWDLAAKLTDAVPQPPVLHSQGKSRERATIHHLDVPVLQVILSGGTVEQWSAQFQGLSPRDMAINVALPEVDGRIITRAVSFKAVQTQNSQLETDVVIYQPHLERIEFVADLAANWVRLRQTPPEKRRIALILANYPCRDGRLANGVGLDTPASCVEILKALQQAGYWVENIPATGDELMQRLTAGVTNDPEGQQLRPAMQQLSLEEYQAYFATLPVEVQKEICARWEIANGSFHSQAEPGNKGNDSQALPGNEGNREENQLAISNYQLAIPGIQLGNIFVGIQPSRGYDLDPSLNYHAPDLEPPHHYLAFYYWVRQHFACHAIAHIGKHGNLEWLPGKSVALSHKCYPEIALGALPHLYPFIVNDPGEGSSAKRRAQAVIIAHLTPPMTRAELYGPLQQLESLIDEYYEAQSLDPSRLPAIRSRIAQLVEKENLHIDLQIANRQENQLPITNYPLPITQLDGYLCELKEAQIRDGLHIFGQCPQGRQLRDLIVAIARHPGVGRLGLTRALAQDFGLDFDPLTADMSVVIDQTRQQPTPSFPGSAREQDPRGSASPNSFPGSAREQDPRGSASPNSFPGSAREQDPRGSASPNSFPGS
ncbi:cobaltochelatase subunit CobN, partial [Microseira wollei]|uniref:cobaltochelatase subunit CobN n=1 Tax=Microseira wollei TaxID=467598 RepID=UPI001CFF41C6